MSDMLQIVQQILLRRAPTQNQYIKALCRGAIAQPCRHGFLAAAGLSILKMLIHTTINLIAIAEQGDTESMNLDHVNLTNFPLHQPDSDAFQRLVVEWRSRLKATGLISLEEFLTPEGVDCLRSEVYERLPSAFHSVHGAQAYFDKMPGEFPTDALGSNTHCLGHHNLQSSAMDALYNWEPLRNFIAALTGNPEVFLHEDPTNALVVQVYKPGCWTGWHFDRAIFTTIVNLGEPEAGGIFECVPDIRTEDNPCYEDVRDVLLEQSDRVSRHDMKAGSLTLMLGRYSLHRVTPVEKTADRISLVLKYETEPGVFISAKDRKHIYGPSAPGPDSAAKIATN